MWGSLTDPGIACQYTRNKIAHPFSIARYNVPAIKPDCTRRFFDDESLVGFANCLPTLDPPNRVRLSHVLRRNLEHDRNICINAYARMSDARQFAYAREHANIGAGGRSG